MSKHPHSLPPGLDRAIISVLASHLGRRQPISLKALHKAVSAYRVNTRQVREQVKQLRRQGFLIGSAPGETGGYYMIADAGEFHDFMQTEFMAIITDMSETAAAMRRAADRHFNTVRQPYLLDFTIFD